VEQVQSSLWGRKEGREGRGKREGKREGRKEGRKKGRKEENPCFRAKGSEGARVHLSHSVGLTLLPLPLCTGRITQSLLLPLGPGINLTLT
jgi:hypothetical protein